MSSQSPFVDVEVATTVARALTGARQWDKVAQLMAVLQVGEYETGIV
jgi:hypothetical protein